MADQTISIGEKRAILASWASDAAAVASNPALRELPGTYRTVTIDEVLEALSALEQGPKEPPRKPGCDLPVLRSSSITVPNQFPTFDVVVKKSRRTAWRWYVRTSEGNVVMRGSEGTRSVARYKAERALFLLLQSAPYRTDRAHDVTG